MQTLESLGVPASAFLIPHNMPEAPNGQQQGWGHHQQGFNPQMDNGMSPQSNHIFVMNNVSVKPEQQAPRREEVLSSPPPPANPSVITATYNPTYNRCLPKILSDLDCEMKIKQVLRCIENILLENGDVDLQQQAYKLPDRSSSPQFAKTKKPKFKEDEEMQSPGPASINLPLATNSPATLINKGGANNKNPIKINVKLEPEDKPPGMRTGYEQAVPRAQMYDAFPYKQQQQQQQQQPQPQPQQSHTSQQYPPSPMGRSFGYENYNGHGQPMASPHMHLSMSSPHLAASATSSPHLQHLHTSSPHMHTAQHSPHVHSPLHSNSPHLVHSPHPHSPLVQSNQQTHSPHINNAPHHQHSMPNQYHMHAHQHEEPQQQQQQQRAPEVVPADYHFQQVFADAVQAGGYKQEGAPPQKKEPAAMPNMQDFVLDPALFAQYLAANQQQLQQLQQQLHQQQIQHSQLQQQRLQQQQAQPQTQAQAQAQSQQPQGPQQPAQQSQPQPQQPQQQQQAQQQQHHHHQQQPTQAPHSQPQSTQPPQTPAQLLAMAQQLFDPAHPHPISLSGHLPMSLSGHFFQQMGGEGVEDDKWILSLLNTDSSIAHDLSLSGHIPPL